MAERKAKFENRFAHVWADEAPGLSQFTLMVDTDITSAQALAKSLFDARVVSDMLEIHHDTTQKIIFTNGDRHIETHTEPFKYVGITNQERLEQLIEIVDAFETNHTQHHGKFPPCELYTVTIGTGNKEYLQMQIENVLKEKPDKEELLGTESNNLVMGNVTRNATANATKNVTGNVTKNTTGNATKAK